MAEGDNDTITALPERAAATATRARRTVRRAAGRATAVAKQAVDDFSDEAGGDMQERISALREQMSHLTEQVEEYASHSLSDARDLAAEVGHAGAKAAQGATRQAAAAARAVREDPLPTVLTLGVLAVLAAFIISRNNR